MKKVKKSLPIVLGSVFVFIIIGYFLGSRNLISIPKLGLQNISPNILYLTSPVTSFSGKVTKINKNNIWVTQELKKTTLISKPNVQQNIDMKNITYKVNIKGADIIFTEPSISQENINEAKKVEIKIGQYVNVKSNDDLRTLRSAAFDAATVEVYLANSIIGEITKIEGNKIYINALPPKPSFLASTRSNKESLEEVTYAIKATENTEILAKAAVIVEPLEENAEPTQSEIRQYSLEDLTPGIYITVYTEDDFSTKQEVTATKIVPDFSLLSPDQIPTGESTLEEPLPPLPDPEEGRPPQAENQPQPTTPVTTTHQESSMGAEGI